MAHGRPWYQRNGGDIVMAVLHFPDSDHKWAYSAIIDMLNDRDRPITDDAGFICGFTGLSKRKWNVVRAFLIAHGYLVTTGDDQLTNPRFERERAVRMGDKAKAVQHGREGGLKSAAMRAAQPEFELSSDYPPEKVEKKSPKNQVKLESKFEVEDATSPENNNLAEPPPQARAHASPRQRRETIKKEEESTPTPSGIDAARTADDDDDGDDEGADPWALAQHFHRIGGVTPGPSPEAQSREVAIVGSWLNDGINPEQAASLIEDHLLKSNEERISSLRYYDGPVRRALAADRAKSRRTAKPVQSNGPIPIRDDDSREVANLRARIRLNFSARNYDGWLSPDHTAIRMNGTGVVMETQSDFMTNWISDNFLHKLNDAAAEQAIPSIRIQTYRGHKGRKPHGKASS